MQARTLILATTALLFAACGGKEQPAPKPTPAPAPTVGAETAPAPAPDAIAAPVPAPDTAAPPAAAEEPAEDWLIWFDSGEGFATRWVRVTGDSFEQVAEKKAVMLSDGARIWRLERRDVEVTVSSCGCLDDEDAPDCEAYAKLTHPGLVAVDLDGGAVTEIRVADSAATLGSDITLGLGLAGGVGSRLIYRWSDEGYYCGAHGSVDHGHTIFDIAQGERANGLEDEIQASLPKAVLEPAATELLPLLKECEEEPDWTVADAIERMQLGGIDLGLDGGEVDVTWYFSASVPYVCSATYTSDGSASSGLLPGGAPLGLDALPSGLAAALAPLTDRATVGWSKLDLEGDARAATLARFEEAPELVWGKSSFTDVALAKTKPAEPGAARALLSEARKQTRAKRYDEAIASFTRALALDPKLAAAASGRGYAELLRGQLDAAARDFDAALTMSSSPGFQGQVWFNLGQIAERRGDLDAARSAYAKSIELRPNDTVTRALERLK